MSQPFTHDVVATALLNEALQVHRAQQDRGLPGMLEHQECRNQVDITGPSWAQSSNTWALERITDEGFFELRLRARRRSRLFGSATGLPRTLSLTAIELTAWFPKLAEEMLRYQESAGILDDRGDAYSRAERVFIQVQSQASKLSSMVDASAREQIGGGTGLVRALKPALEEALRDNLSSLTAVSYTHLRAHET